MVHTTQTSCSVKCTISDWLSHTFGFCREIFTILGMINVYVTKTEHNESTGHYGQSDQRYGIVLSLHNRYTYTPPGDATITNIQQTR